MKTSLWDLQPICHFYPELSIKPTIHIDIVSPFSYFTVSELIKRGIVGSEGVHNSVDQMVVFAERRSHYADKFDGDILNIVSLKHHFQNLADLAKNNNNTSSIPYKDICHRRK